MKRIFFGVTYLLLLVMMFTYMLIDCAYSSGSTYAESIVTVTANTGLSIIGVIFVIPAFVFTIIALASAKDIMEFIRDMLSLFASAFLMVSTIIAFTMKCSAYYIPSIELLCDLVIFGLSLYGVITKIKGDTLKKKASEEEQALEQKKAFDEAVDRKVNEIINTKNEAVVEATEVTE